jgi:hypothetical protein
MTGHEWNTTKRIVVARKPHRCDGYRCRGWISRSDRYTRSVCFPGHDANGGTRPWVMKLCAECAPITIDEPEAS